MEYLVVFAKWLLKWPLALTQPTERINAHIARVTLGRPSRMEQLPPTLSRLRMRVLSHHVGPPELSALEAIDTNGKVLSPQQAIHAVGEKVTVDFTVDSIELADDRVYLVASGPSSGADAKGFRVALPAHLVAAMRRNGYDWPAALRGAQLRLVGIVERDAGFGQILAGDLDQIASISYAEGVNPKRSSGRHALDGSEEPTTPRKNQTISPLEAKKIVDDLTDAIKELTRDIILPLGSPDDKRSAIGTLPSLPQPKNPPQPK